MAESNPTCATSARGAFPAAIAGEEASLARDGESSVQSQSARAKRSSPLGAEARRRVDAVTLRARMGAERFCPRTLRLGALPGYTSSGSEPRTFDPSRN